MGFHPEVLRVPAGTTVNWTNLDGMEHSVQLGMLDGGFVLPPSPALTLTWWPWVAPPAAAAILLLLLLRRKWRKTEGTSKLQPKSRTKPPDQE